MKFSEAWLREWVNPEISTEKLLEQLTMAGLEVDSVESAAPEFEKVVVGKILSVAPHPDADRLRVTTVAISAEGSGDEPLTIVTNVADIAVDEMIAVAKVGCVLPPAAEGEKGLKIKKAKLRGVPSFGMFCSMATLGLVEEGGELERFPATVIPGTDIRKLLGLDDKIVEVDLTPNRGDCLSIIGVAREVGAINQHKVGAITESFSTVAINSDANAEKMVSVAVEDSESCPRYLGRVIEGVDPAALTPLWMQERLRRAGMRSLGPLVDVTNYVMLELGQPMHAFDLAQLNGSVVVRRATNGEKMVLLDGKELILNQDALVIADGSTENGAPLALAGIMGGEHSGVSDNTTDLFLECAFFAPLAIAGKARSYGMHTDSSHRFERGVDPELQQLAMDRATSLLLEIAGGRTGEVTEVVDNSTLPKQNNITLRRDRLQRSLGLDIGEGDSNLKMDEVSAMLTALGMQVELEDNEWRVLSPSWRFDLKIEADLIEEVARIYGYDRLPSTHPEWSAEIEPITETILTPNYIRHLLVNQGYHEVITYSFVDPEMQKIVDPESTALALANPISSDLSVMRTTLWSGLLQTLSFNLKRQQSQVRLFEMGLRFIEEPDGTLRQQNMLSGVLFGDITPEQWGSNSRAVDFFDLKGDLEPLLTPLNASLSIRDSVHPLLHPGKAAQVDIAENSIGWIGSIHPGVAVKLSLPKNIYLFEFELEPLQQRDIFSFQQLSKFPTVRRDIAILVKDSVAAQELIDTVKESVTDKILRDVSLFDLYQGDNLAPDEKSIALSIILQDSEKTLIDEEVDDIIKSIVSNLKQNFEAKLRD
jgi:phenylalanyl-tRNA synthetase beta chain